MLGATNAVAMGAGHDARAADDIARSAASYLEQRLWPDQLAEAARGVGAWLWHGYLGAGRMTLLTSQWKAGKTTLLANLVARMARGGTLAGLPVAAAKVAILSEEGPSNWEARCRKLSIGNHVSFFCRPFRGRPSPADWRGLLDSLLVLRREEGLDLVAVDPLAVFLPTGNENSATAMMDCLLPLQDLTAAGLCLLICHHPRKGRVQYGQAARGSGALPSLVDVLIEMKWHSSDGDDRRRWLRTFSRHEETPRTLLVELTAEGNDYLTHDIHHDEVSVQAGDVLFLVLEDATDRLTQRQILEQWPEDFPRPDQSTIARALKQGMAAGRILQKGTGRKNDPFLYWLAGKEEGFHPGPGASIDALASWNDRLVTKWLATLGVPYPAPCAATAQDAAPAAADPAPSICLQPAIPDENAPAASLPSRPEGPSAAPAAVDILPATVSIQDATPAKASAEPGKPALSGADPQPGILQLLAQQNANKTDWKKWRRLPP